MQIILLTRPQAAKYLEISIVTLDRWRVSGKVHTHWDEGRAMFRQDELERVKARGGPND